MLDTLPQIAWIARAGRIERFNRRWHDYTGYDVAGNGACERQLEAAVHPADLQRVRAALTGDGKGLPVEFRLRRNDGVDRWFSLHAASLDVNDPTAWLAVCTDVDDHKRQGLRFAFIARAGEALAESLDLQTTLERLLAIIVPDFGDWAAIDLFDENGRLKTAAAVAADSHKSELVRKLVGRYNHNSRAEPTIAAALRRNRPLILAGVTDETIAKAAAPDLLDVLSALAPRSALTLPLRTRGWTIGSLVAYWAETPRQYSEDDLPLFEELTRRAAVSIENARLYEREREIATQFQRAALPSTLPKIPGIQFDGIYVPASDRELLGGDWYDALRLDDGRIVISIGDVAGSGLAAAVIMSSMRQVIRGVAQVYADPIAMLEAADRTLKTEHPDTYVTAFAGVLDPVAGTLTYASAGHPPPFLRTGDETVTALASGALPLGLRSRGDAPVTLTLPEPAFLVFYTDGLIEAGHDLVAGSERLVAALTNDVVESECPAQALYRAVLDGDGSDDVVILTVRLDARSALRWSFDSSDGISAGEARHAFVAALRSRGMPDDDVHTAELIFGELIGNVARYAPGPIEIMFDWSDHAPVLHVLDRGPGFTLVPRLPSDLLSERGRGLYIVWTLAEDFNVTERFDGGSHARVVLSSPNPPQK